MSFICKACGRQRAGSPAEGEEVCRDCRPTQMGRAALLLRHFDQVGRELVGAAHVRSLVEILDEAQNTPPEGLSDGSIDPAVWEALWNLVRAAEAYDRAVDLVPYTVRLVALERAKQQP